MGQALYGLLQALAADYGQEPAYQVAARLFAEQSGGSGDRAGQGEPRDQRQ